MDCLYSYRLLAQLPVDGIPQVLLQTASAVSDESIRKTDASQGDGYSSNISSDFLNSDFMEEQILADMDIVVLENTGVINVSATSDQDLCSSAASHLYGIFRGSKIQSEFPDADHIMDMFPSLFLYGRGGPGCAHRSKVITLEVWVKHLLQLAGRKFARHHAFIFAVFSILLFLLA